ncbi:MAG: c-type cytochrome [Chloroflexota bacterium]
MKRLLPLLLLLLLLPAPLAAQEPIVPTAPPDTETGYTIFADRCTPCHGEQGGGDGPMVVNLQVRPAVFADPAYRQTAVPTALFDTITNGRLERFMPPFGTTTVTDPIAEADRWNLIATIFSLSTPAEAVERGATIYQENCAACHGNDGNAPGPTVGGAPPDLTDLAYWFSRSNQMVLDGMAGAAAHTYTLDDQALSDAVDFSRTFSYTYTDLFPPLEPIEAATIAGQVVNGSTSATMTGLEATLRAFTANVEEALTLTAPVGQNGRFSFDLTLIPPDWVYIVSVDYNGTRFSSEVGQLDPNQPTLDMPITVYDATTDPSVVAIDRIHLITEFVGDTIRINELYIFSNRAPAIYTGDTGDPAQGTVRLVLPTGAQNVAFQRAFQSLSSFIPATEMIQTDLGWADTLPLRPGEGSLNLLVQYELPYESGLTIAHPLVYDAAQILLLMPDVGVSVADDGGWLAQGSESLSSGAFLTYTQSGLAAGEAVNVTINGRPRVVTDAGGNNLLVRNETAELAIGTVALLLSLVVVGGLLWHWQQAATTEPTTAHTLLQDLAALDDAHDAGELADADYQRQRTELKDQLHQLWD